MEDMGIQMHDTVPLTQLRHGQTAKLTSTLLEKADAEALRALGLRPLCNLRVCRGGEPCIVSVVSGACSCRIGLSKALASKVLVSPAS